MLRLGLMGLYDICEYACVYLYSIPFSIGAYILMHFFKVSRGACVL